MVCGQTAMSVATRWLLPRHIVFRPASSYHLYNTGNIPENADRYDLCDDHSMSIPRLIQTRYTTTRSHQIAYMQSQRGVEKVQCIAIN
jgi:hypothetical protein